MTLALKYDSSVSRAANAVYIRGGSPSIWLSEIAQLGVALERLDCYAVPESIRSISAAGLLVTIRGDVTAIPDHLPAYSLMGGQLYLPQQSVLYPAVTEEELRQILLWEVQFFHPTIGLVGFEKGDRLDLLSLIDYPEPKTLGWNLARPGQAPMPALERISVEALDEDVMSLFEKDIDRKPLSEIPKSPKDTSGTFDKIKKDVAYHSLKAAMDLKNALSKWLSDGNTSSRSGSAPVTPADGIFGMIAGFFGLLFLPLVTVIDKAEKWAAKNLEELERERNEELNRLMNMMEEDPFEALKYAIPLSSIHEPRGQGEQGSKLMPRNTNFDLRSLGGGKSADVWDIGDHYYKLRTQYLNAAAKEIERKNFKRAAYIYAHLLADFNLAANVLVQGQMYREAAALYKDHLKNIPAAAECLEKGGLLNDAIDLYLELGKEEKAADLYMQLDQPEAAGKYYLKAADKYIDAKDYLEAARIYEDKMDMTVKASAALLSGWAKNAQPEVCLKKYFELVAAKTPDALIDSIQGIYQSNNPDWARNYFLNTMLHVNKMTEAPEIKETTTTIAYEMISRRISKGDMSNLYMLESFVAEDKMLSTDLRRFAYNNKNTTTVRRNPAKIQLRKDVKWAKAYNHHNQFYALGFKDNHLHFARGNWYGDIDNLVWSESILSHHFDLVISPFQNDKILIYESGETGLGSKYLPANKYFSNALSIESPTCVDQYDVGIAINERRDIAILQFVDGALAINEYTMEGALKKTIDCKLNGELIQFANYRALTLKDYDGGFESPKVIYRLGHYFAIMLGSFISVSAEGRVELYNSDGPIKKFAVSPRLDRAEFLVATDTMIQLLTFGDEVTMIDPINLTEVNKINEAFLDRRRSIIIQEIVVDMIFLSSDRVAIATAMGLQIFHMATPQTVWEREFSTKDTIIGLLTTTNRNSCAALLENGVVEIFEWD